ncbi:poly-beta-1,6-N-acetyl-D-glucosamine synthase [Microbulbifer sp. SAOS-129_SWC]|uniref:poly-beta-1,6-N-acetyl-D-glucosamine synthase n=1 Tax=Microbulbifer sp. SAOS-129_SWC TaxID=3145235 RepID=UPI003216CA11
MNAETLGDLLATFCFGYPFVMAYYWMFGALLYRYMRERYEPVPSAPPALEEYPPISILVPCFNEEQQAEETFSALEKIQYPNFEIIAINDGSRDRTGAVLDELAGRIPNMRVVHLATNQGKSTALNVGALAARHEWLVGIDGDALLDPHALTWCSRRFQNDPLLGGMTGNPRIRNRTTPLGKLQVGEFSAMVGLIKRAETVYGAIFTVSGANCAFRKRALQDAGWWDPAAITDDVDVSWRVQFSGWNLIYGPKGICWILTPETISGLWRQRLRWSEGGTAVVLRAIPYLFRRGGLRMWPLWLNYVVSIMWSYAMLLMIAIWFLALFGIQTPVVQQGFGFLPQQWGMELALTYLLQSLVAASLDYRVESRMFRNLFWVVWYPLVFWILQAASAVVGLPYALLHLRREKAATWVSPDRGFR